MSDQKPVCAIIGAGPGNGAAFAEKFTNEGYQVALVARDLKNLKGLAEQIPGSHGFACDVTQPDAVAATFSAIARTLGNVDVLIYNAGKGAWGSPGEIDPADFESAWRVNAFGALLAAQQVLPSMRAKKAGTIIFVGATASLRGGEKTTGFAAAKAAQRSLAQSLARAHGKDGIHVCVMIIDAVLNEPVARTRLADKPDEFFADTADIAQTAYMLTRQNRSAWTFELDLRPFAENW